MRSLSLVATLFALVALVPFAAAQTMTVSISGAPAAFPDLESNSTASITFNVDVRMSGVVCGPTPATIPITVTVTPSSPPPFFTALAEPAEFTINVPANAYPGDPSGSGSVPGPAFTGSAQGTVVATTTEITANASVPVQISAAAGAPAGCTPAPSGASSEAVTVYANMTAPPPAEVPPPPPEDKGFLPGPGAAMGTIAALAAVALRRGARRS